MTIHVHRFGGEGPPLLLAHATGFCGSVWRPVAERLAGSFDCWSLDFRGHGASGRPASGTFEWRGTADDVLAALTEADAGREATPGAGGPWYGVGHSMGGAALLLTEQRRPGTFRRLWLFEPIVIPPGTFGEAGAPNPLAEGALRRRAAFESREAARANYASKPPMAAFDPAALDAYLDGGLVEQPDGSVRLACEPADEAQVYRMGSEHDAWDHLGEVACPVTVARGGEAFGPATFGPSIVERLAAGRLEEHPDLDHFGPMVDPDAVAASILAALAPG